jgi:hypothetical protein
MSKKSLKGTICISRPPYGDGRDMIRISIRDDLSHSNFLIVEIPHADFAKAITGLGYVPIDMEIRNLSGVGKKLISEPRSVICPIDTYQKDAYKAWLIDNMQEDGWIIDTYLGSQNSVVREGEKTTLNYSVYRYEDVEQ